MESGRLNGYQTAPETMKALRQVEGYIHSSGLDKRPIELVKMRVSQINGCACYLDMHSKDLRRQGRPSSASTC